MSEAKFKLMTEQLRLIHSDEEVADYIRWIIRKAQSVSKAVSDELISKMAREKSWILYNKFGKDKFEIIEFSNELMQESLKELRQKLSTPTQAEGEEITNNN